jgi:2,5-diketo-D-gluconate reductase A
MQLGNILIPKSVNPFRIASNFDVFDFEPSASEIASISSLEDGTDLVLIRERSLHTGR